MRIATLASASVAIAVAATLFDPIPAEAATQRRVVRKAQNTTVVKPRTLQRHVKKSHVAKLKVEKKTLKVEKKLITKTPAVGTGSAAAFAKKGGTQLKLGRLPINTAVASTTLRAGRVSLPKNFKPKLTLAHDRKRSSSIAWRRSCSGTGRRRSSGSRSPASAI